MHTASASPQRCYRSCDTTMRGAAHEAVGHNLPEQFEFQGLHAPGTALSGKVHTGRGWRGCTRHRVLEAVPYFLIPTIRRKGCWNAHRGARWRAR